MVIERLIQDPLMLRRYRSFKKIKRGYYSFILFVLLCLFSFCAELFINNRALLVRYQGQYYFPTYGSILPGKTFGLNYDYETNYRELQKKFAEQQSNNFVIMPLVPYGPLEIEIPEGLYPPLPPDFESRHFLGTDHVGRDLLARLVYGFRIAMVFSLGVVFFNYLIGIILGSLMGYWGGKFDLVVQRIIEVWVNIPVLYAMIILASIMQPSLTMLILIFVALGWTSMTWYMRTETYREKAREYVLAARSLGFSTTRIILRHIIPNTLAVIVTFSPFAIAGGIVGLVSLDYLGFGLPAPTPSWGELLNHGMIHLEDGSWIIISVVTSIVIVLTMVTFIGEAIRESFDPKRFSVYE